MQTSIEPTEEPALAFAPRDDLAVPTLSVSHIVASDHVEVSVRPKETGKKVPEPDSKTGYPQFAALRGFSFTPNGMTVLMSPSILSVSWTATDRSTQQSLREVGRPSGRLSFDPGEHTMAADIPVGWRQGRSQRRLSG